MRIEQVIIALVSNAIKYGEGRPIDVVVTREGDTAVVTVHDHGIGIERAHLASIFDRFERRVSSRHYGGFGVGLWVARQIVEASGGRILVESEIGHGATFRVELPTASR
jgi:signal transduction histidine kinase